ncbi:MAG TPA: methyltransferase domain-containing protein [Gaiellaceae bacterium]|nr:methyltransferase domain-containing protein [Gaiellaceae bacterium]
MQVEPLDAIYGRRFDDADAAAKLEIWEEIAHYLQRFVDPGSTVLDLACDRGHFIRAIEASEKWASDARDVSAHLDDDVHFVRADGLELADALENEHFDVVFMSNYLEHLPSGDAVVEQFRVVRELLRSGGRAIVLQPNIRLVGGRYWDFIDHKVALTERSLAEAAELAGLEVERTITRFLPYTTKSRLPQSRRLVRAYLAFPPAWLLLGRQTLFIARRA